MNKTFITPYFVGQGMCTLIHNSSQGILLDSGAGTPITRNDFLKINKNQNTIDDLNKDIDKLKSITLILSHADCDHYNLYCWSLKIRSKVEKIYLPDKQINPLYLQRNLRAKLIKVSYEQKIEIEFEKLKLKIHRTKNNSGSSKKNDNCIVTHIIYKNINFLFPGDYLLSGFSNDENSNIKNLLEEKFEFISVPHHGAKDCIDKILKKNHQPRNSLAFFSAGNNNKCNHPVNETVQSYAKNGFDIAYNKNPIKITRLINYEFENTI